MSINRICWSQVKSEFEGINWSVFILIFILGIITNLAVVYLSPSAVGTSIASFIALLIAFVAYPWQKSKDRAMKVDDERRSAQAKVIAAGSNMRRRLVDRAGVGHREVATLENESAQFDEAVSVLAIYSSEQEVRLAQKYRSAVTIYLSALRKEKAARPEVPEGKTRVKRTPDYQVLIDGRHLAYKDMKAAEEAFINAVSVKHISLDRRELDRPEEAYDSEQQM